MMIVVQKVTEQEEMQNYYDEMSAAFNLSDRDMGSLFTISVNDLCVSFQDARNGK